MCNLQRWQASLPKESTLALKMAAGLQGPASKQGENSLALEQGKFVNGKPWTGYFGKYFWRNP